MSRLARRWLIALTTLVVAIGGAAGWILASAHATIEDARVAVERWKLADARHERGRPPLLQPAEEGDAWEIYRELLDDKDAMDSYRRAVDPTTVSAIVRAAHRRLTIPAEANLDTPRPDGEDGRWPCLTFANRVEDGPDSDPWGFRTQCACLVLALDGVDFACVEEAEFLESLMIRCLERLRQYLGENRPGEIRVRPASYPMVAQLLQRLAQSPMPSERWIGYQGADAARKIAETHERPRQARWLWSDDVARADAVRAVSREHDLVCDALRRSPLDLRRRAVESVTRASEEDNPYFETGPTFWSGSTFGRRSPPDPLPSSPWFESAAMIESRQAWHRVLASARAALAVAQFADREQALPRMLEALVPAYLPSIPIDPTTGRPLTWWAGIVGLDDSGVPLRAVAAREWWQGCEFPWIGADDQHWTVARPTTK